MYNNIAIYQDKKSSSSSLGDTSHIGFPVARFVDGSVAQTVGSQFEGVVLLTPGPGLALVTVARNEAVHPCWTTLLDGDAVPDTLHTLSNTVMMGLVEAAADISVGQLLLLQLHVLLGAATEEQEHSDDEAN